MPETHRTHVLIIGSGPAGYTAAIYAARASLQPILVAGLEPGGQLTITTDVENYPGLRRGDPGALADGADGGAGRACRHPRSSHDLITRVDFRRRPFRCVADSGDVFLADAVIIATGAQARWLGMPSPRSGFRAAASRPAPRATVSSSAARRSRWSAAVIPRSRRRCYLTHHADSVTLIHRRDTLRAEKILQARLFAHPKIKVVWDSVVEEIEGGGSPEVVTGVRLRNVKTGVVQQLPVDGVFIAIGHTPNTAIFAGQVAMDARATS